MGPPTFSVAADGTRVQELAAGDSGGRAARSGDRLLIDYVLRRANGYFIYSTVEGVSFQPADVPVGPVEVVLVRKVFFVFSSFSFFRPLFFLFSLSFLLSLLFCISSPKKKKKKKRLFREPETSSLGSTRPSPGRSQAPSAAPSCRRRPGTPRRPNRT